VVVPSAGAAFAAGCALQDRSPAKRRLRSSLATPWRVGQSPDATIGRVNYELYMGAALSEAKAALMAGDKASGAVAVLDEALVARGQSQVITTGDPTAHAVMVVLREAARRLGRFNLSGLVVFTANEPCAMCVGALLESDVDGLVYALPDPARGAAGSHGRSPGEALRERVRVVSGIMQAEAAELREGAVGQRSAAAQRG
jgi:tRNA(adenine34) deaminase